MSQAKMQAMESITNFMTTFAAITLALGVVMVIAGGFKYIVSVAEVSEMEKGKNIIINGAVGVFLSMIAFATASMFGSSVPQEEIEREVVESTSSGPYASLLLLFLLMLPLFILIFGMLRNRERVKKEENEIQKSELLEEVKEANYVEEMKDSTYEEIGIEILEHYAYIINSIKELKPHLDKMDVESKHQVEESIEKDAFFLLKSYLAVDEEHKEAYKAKVVNGLVQINNELVEIKQKASMKDVEGLEKALLVVKNKYADKIE